MREVVHGVAADGRLQGLEPVPRGLRGLALLDDVGGELGPSVVERGAPAQREGLVGHVGDVQGTAR